MSKQTSPDPEPRDQQLGVMLTKAEKAQVRRFANELGMSLSNAGRYLIRRGLATFPTEGE